ncbi:hypothetical protein GTA08_BOTSDO09470 [Neofusicoccum parvum]|uniref:Uncharacterized protein n=1 Tax=Neofusicoccum parvum TaxID=310453 RepID=A0ACB5SD54_9PEZI|nr:hypothetical protein GTA08_BOTSDO09470 [Neofusicoccum parvum]
MSGSAKVIAIHFGVMIPLQALALSACFLRVYTRIFITNLRLGLEDWCIGAVATMTGACALAIAVADTHFGEGLDPGTSPQALRMRVQLYQTQWSTSIIYAIEGFFLKTAVLLLYRRIFTLPRFHAVCTHLLCLNAVCTLANVLAFTFICQPISHFWEQLLPNTSTGKCVDFRAVWITFGSINVATDFIAVLLPIPVLRNLHTQRRKRKFLMCIFAFSFVPCIASITRILSLRHVTARNLGRTIWRHDLWCGVEMTLGITCACLPTLTPFASRHFPALLDGIAYARDGNDEAPTNGKEGGPGGSGGGGDERLPSEAAVVLGVRQQQQPGLQPPSKWWWGRSTLMDSVESLPAQVAGEQLGRTVVLRDLPKVGAGDGDELAPRLDLDLEAGKAKDYGGSSTTVVGSGSSSGTESEDDERDPPIVVGTSWLR